MSSPTTNAPGYEAGAVNPITGKLESLSLASGPPATGDAKTFVSPPLPSTVAGESSGAPAAEAAPASALAPAPELPPREPAAIDTKVAAVAAGSPSTAPPSAVAHSVAPSQTGTAVAAAGPPIKAKELKKFDKIIAKQAQGDEKALRSALKDGGAADKALRKAKKAEAQSLRRHTKAVEKEHKRAKELNKAMLKHEKAKKALEKAIDELDIKKRHTVAKDDAASGLKSKIDSVTAEKQAHDAERAQRSASMHGRPVVA